MLIAFRGDERHVPLARAAGKMRVYGKTRYLGSKKSGDPGWGPPLWGELDSSPYFKRSRQILEGELGRDREASRIAGEDLRRYVEHRRRRNREVVYRRAGESDGGHIAN